MGKEQKIPAPFPSHLWAKKYVEMLNSDKAYEDSAKSWEGAMLFVIQPDGGHTPVMLGCWLDLWHGECRGYDFWVEGQEKPENQYEFSGPEKNWLAMIDGKIDPIQGLMTGKFKLVGNMAMVMRHTLAAKILVETLQKFDFDIISTKEDANSPKLTFRDKNGEVILTLDQQTHTFELLK